MQFGCPASNTQTGNLNQSQGSRHLAALAYPDDSIAILTDIAVFAVPAH
jgi:hypothetical protein